MMFSKKLQEYAREKYVQRLPVLGETGEMVEQKLLQCTFEEQILMKYFYGTMPLRDAGEYEFEVFLGFVRHALMVRRTMEWCREIPEEIFVHDILYYRINSENIEDCRRFFYDKLIGRIEGKNLREAVIEINYWCAENGAYEASDYRTISPMTLYRSGKGRCGEESTFAVTAFRSVGIPARQVYTPRWAHCDDNHAWVEVYVDGKWNFLGACEPEEILNKGWFTNASSRALLVHARNFSDYGDGFGEQCVGREDRIWFYNVTPTYAKTRWLEIRVMQEKKTPAAQAEVFVEVLNSGEYFSIARLCTDSEGKTGIQIGLGTVHLRAVKGKMGCEAAVNTAEQAKVTLALKEEWFAENQEEWVDIDIEAPGDAPVHRGVLTKEQKDLNRKKLSRASKLRQGRIESYYTEGAAEKYPEEKELLRLAAGNFDEIYQFLSKDDHPDRKALLHSLSVKDYKDAKGRILESHLVHARRYREVWEKRKKLDIYTKYILCPRIHFEELTEYRTFIEMYFGCQADWREEFRKNPFAIWEYIKKAIRYDSSEDYGTVFETPVCALRLRFGSPISQRILLVAICRTLGIPARINKVNSEAEVYLGETFVQVTGKTVREAGEKSEITLKKKDDQVYNYYQNWTIARFEKNQFVTLNYEGIRFEQGELHLEAEPGFYCVRTTNRLPNGNQQASEYRFRLEREQSVEIEMRQRSGRPHQMLVNHPLEDFQVEEEGRCVEMSSLTGRKVNLLAFLDEGQEPTEHVLNEMLEHGENISSKMEIFFVLKDEGALKNETIRRVLERIPGIRVLYGKFEEIAEPLARRMYVDPDKLPLLILAVPGLTGVYACSGYNVGSVGMLLRLAEIV